MKPHQIKMLQIVHFKDDFGCSGYGIIVGYSTYSNLESDMMTLMGLNGESKTVEARFCKVARNPFKIIQLKNFYKKLHFYDS